MHINFIALLLILYSLINHTINHTLSFFTPFNLLIILITLIVDHSSIVTLLNHFIVIIEFVSILIHFIVVV